jgi:hypothetical protein
MTPEDKEFGPLSTSDQTALAGQKPTIRDAIADLSAGIVDIRVGEPSCLSPYTPGC